MLFLRYHLAFYLTLCILITQDGYTPLHIAAGNGHFEAVEMLLNANATIDLTDQVGLLHTNFRSIIYVMYVYCIFVLLYIRMGAQRCIMLH